MERFHLSDVFHLWTRHASMQATYEIKETGEQQNSFRDPVYQGNDCKSRMTTVHQRSFESCTRSELMVKVIDICAGLEEKVEGQ